jgi:hypothetical protein
LIILEDAIEKKIDPQASSFVGKVFSLNNPNEIQKLLSRAGFHHINLEKKQKTLNLPAPKDFLWQYVFGTPLAGLFTDIGEEAKKDFEQVVVEGWRKLTIDDRIVIEQPIIEVTCLK